MSKFLRDLYDIRVKPDRSPMNDPNARRCEWDGCCDPGVYRAPKSRERLRDYHWFCLDHVRRYNASWNYFAGMPEPEIERYARENVTGHRPTWRVDMGRFNAAARSAGARVWEAHLHDPFGFFQEEQPPMPDQEARRPRRRLPAAVARALAVLDLDETVSLKEIKTRYKQLVKRYHPDANGGDRTAEDRLREIIHAYQQLKASGFS